MNLKRLGASMAAFALLLPAGCGGGGSATAESADLTKANFASEVSTAQIKARTAHLEADISAQGQQVSMAGDVDMTKDDVAFDLALTGGPLGQGTQFILVDRVIYLKMPTLTHNDKFIKIDTGSSGNPMAHMFDQMLNQLNPTQAFKAFDAITGLQKHGTQEIDGVETTKYTVTVDTQKALQAQGMAGRVPAGQLPKTIQYDVWVDADHLVRRLVMTMPGSSVDMTLSQWGEPVHISAPPAGQTTDMGGLMQQMMPSRSGG